MCELRSRLSGEQVLKDDWVSRVLRFKGWCSLVKRHKKTCFGGSNFSYTTIGVLLDVFRQCDKVDITSNHRCARIAPSGRPAGSKICNVCCADWVRAQCCSFVVIDHSKRLAEVVVHHLLTSSVLSLAQGLRFSPKLGLAPTSEGFNDVSDWCARLWFT